MMGFWFCHREERSDVAISYMAFFDSLKPSAHFPGRWQFLYLDFQSNGAIITAHNL
jgi:hypothetical protein